MTALGRDQPTPLELFEQRKRAVDKHEAFTSDTVDCNDAARCIAAVDDAPALRQRVKHALFML